MPAEVRETSLKTGFMSLDVVLLAFVEIFTSFLFILFYIYIFALKYALRSCTGNEDNLNLHIQNLPLEIIEMVSRV